MVMLDSMVDAVLREFPEDRLTYQRTIPTFHPESAEEASRFFRLVNRGHQKTYITSFGNIIDPVGERFADLVVLRTDRLNDLIEINPDDLYVTVETGYPLRELNLHLSKQNLFLPHADLPYVGSVGGAVAVNLTGDLNGHLWPIKKYLIKAQVVLPHGDIINPGSVCFKSVSGYDIVKLFAGSWGLLGLVVTATFRVLPTSAREEYVSLKMNAVDRANFLRGLDVSSNETDVIYSRKIKEKFDPNGILPVV